MGTCVMDSQPVIPNGEHKQPKSDQVVNAKQLLEGYTLPKFNCSNFPFANYPLADAVSEHVDLWLRKHQIDTECFESDAIYQKFLAHKIEELPLKTQVSQSLTRVRWISNLYALYCILDDKVDDTPDGHSPETSVPYFVEFHLVMFWTFPKATRPLVENILSLIDNPDKRKSTKELFDTVLAKAETQPGTDYPAKVSALASGFRELWCQASGDCPQEWGVRFARESQRFLLGLFQETKNRGHQTGPSIPDYIKMRRTTGCMHVVVGASTGYVADAHLPDSVYCSPEVQKMLDSSSDVTNWINDIFSLPKELKKGDVHNLVWLISLEQKCSMTVAAAKVAEMVENECDEVRRIGAVLEQQTAPEYRHAVRTLTEKCSLHITSFLAYHRTSPRYWSEARDRDESERKP